MPHDTPLITTIVAAFVLAFIFGAIANRFRLPPLVGYLVAGVLCGPFTPGFVADQSLATQLSELGVILLMFGVGLHFSLKDLMSVRALAIPGALVQIAFATALGVGLALLLGWGLGAGLVFGLALSVASTVVLLKALQDRRLIETERGRIAVGWLIVEDLAMVLALVLIPALAPLLGGDTVTVMHDPFVSLLERLAGTDFGLSGVIGITLVKVAAFVGFMLIVGRRIIPWMLHAVAHTGNRELFRLAVLAIALGVALGASYLFGVSLALGAFFAGMILSESELSHRAAQETLPLRDAFAVLFFVSAGMLFDPQILITNPLPVLATLFIIIVGKSAAAFVIVVVFRRPVSTALTIAASLAQIGEFSFILAAMGVALHILPQAGSDLILAGAILSIVLNPLVFFIVERMRPRMEARIAARQGEPAVEATEPRVEPTLADAVAAAPEVVAAAVHDSEDDTPVPTTLSGHIILVGFGRVGTVVGEGLKAAGTPFVLVEDSDHRVAAARDMGIEIVVGNAAASDVLHLANVAGAKTLLIAIPNAFEAGQATEQARRLNPGIEIIARSHSDEEEDYLKKLGANTVIMGEREIGLGMLSFLKSERAMPQPIAEDIPAPGPKLAPGENFIVQAVKPEVAIATAVVAANVNTVEAAETAEAVEEAQSLGDIEPTTPPELIVTPEPEPGVAPEVIVLADRREELAAAVDVAEPVSVEPAPVEPEPAEAAPVLVESEPEPEPATPEPVPQENPPPAEPVTPPAQPVELPGSEPAEAPVEEPAELPSVTPPVEPEIPPAAPEEMPVPELPNEHPAPEPTPVGEPEPQVEIPVEAPSELPDERVAPEVVPEPKAS
jgi:CPA2 family monovalent cation:H+ antiporter-2